ncbi:hypothetical protein KR222_007799, partial [Zaprionus bogoriensis]
TAATVLEPQSEPKPESIHVLETETEPVPEQRIDCKLTFDATMDSLERKPQGCSNNKRNKRNNNSNNNPNNKQQQQATNKPAASPQLRHRVSGDSSQPVYELQLVVWPVDMADELDEDWTTTTTRATTTTTTTTTEAPTPPPLYEDQLVVFPQMDFEEENFDYFFDELETAVGPSTTRPRPTPPAATPSGTGPVRVVENYHMRFPNGTEEHKLVLSNGLVNYMRLYLKRVDGRLVNVQEGYNSVPTTGKIPQIETLYYIADERGYNVYRSE